MNGINFKENELKELFSAIGILDGNGESHKDKSRKYQQIIEYLKHLNKAINKLSRKRELVLVDCACGKSYLSFVVNYYYSKIEKRKIKFICIDYNEGVIESSKKAAKELGFDNMNFICSDIFEVEFLDVSPDIVYSLHACDIATDMTIAKGVLEGAKYIMVVSCCQHTIRNQIRRHPLKAITRHNVYKERLVDMIADSMRGLVLESKGYKVKLFDYVPSSQTPKNVMLRAERLGIASDSNIQKSIEEYKMLQEMFNVDVKLDEYISKYQLI